MTSNREENRRSAEQVSEDRSRGKPGRDGGPGLSDGLRRTDSPLGLPVWRLILLTAAGCVAAFLAVQPAEGSSPWIGVAAVLSLVAWLAAVRLLLLDARAKLFWLIWLAGGLILLVSRYQYAGMEIAALAFSAVFLIFRRYRPYSHLSSRRKAGLFLLALTLFILMQFGGYPSREEAVTVDPFSDGKAVSEPFSSPAAPSLGERLFQYSYGSLELFWLFSLFYLFFTIRLHFMRLKPKLAVISLMLAGVPLILVIGMGLVTLYATLGESRALRASHLLRDWSESAARDPGFMRSLAEQPLVFRMKADKFDPASGVPDWAAALAARSRTIGWSDTEWDPAESGSFIWVNDELWLAALEADTADRLEIRAARLDRPVLDRLAGILNCDVRLLFSNRLTFTQTGRGGLPEINVGPGEGSLDVIGRLSQNPDGADRTLWRRKLVFGASHIAVLYYDGENRDFSRRDILLLLEGRLIDILGELTSAANPLSRAVLILLAILAALLLILELFAFFFGMRITTGFTSAVRALHRGTRKIARGELNTRIHIPNQDELGDLALAFNEMAGAVAKGREEAIARERLESELQTARRIQERLLPDVIPEISGFEITGTSLPSQEVGGDYFDFLDMGGDRLGIAIGDVSGKGIPAALLMANLQASLHAQAPLSRETADVVSRMNDMLVKSTDADMFATFIYGILDRGSATFHSTNAGHNPPLLFREKGKLERMNADGLILGFMAGQDYTSRSARLEPGDVLVLFTDGITEAVRINPESGEREMFGEDRLIGIVRARLSSDARVIHAGILSAVAAHAGKDPQSDDITLVVIKRRARPAPG